MKRKHTAPRTPYVIVQTYFTITESPFGSAIGLTYGARVAVPAHLYARIPRKGGGFMINPLAFDFHSLIQLPGAFITR